MAAKGLVDFRVCTLERFQDGNGKRRVQRTVRGSHDRRCPAVQQIAPSAPQAEQVIAHARASAANCQYLDKLSECVNHVGSMRKPSNPPWPHAFQPEGDRIPAATPYS